MACECCGAHRRAPEYDVMIESNFHGAVVFKWTTLEESALRLLLRRVCGASETQCNEFIKNFDDVGPNVFNGVDGQEGLAYKLTAIN